MHFFARVFYIVITRCARSVPWWSDVHGDGMLHWGRRRRRTAMRCTTRTRPKRKWQVNPPGRRDAGRRPRSAIFFLAAGSTVANRSSRCLRRCLHRHPSIINSNLSLAHKQYIARFIYYDLCNLFSPAAIENKIEFQRRNAQRWWFVWRGFRRAVTGTFPEGRKTSSFHNPSFNEHLFNPKARRISYLFG